MSIFVIWSQILCKFAIYNDSLILLVLVAIYSVKFVIIQHQIGLKKTKKATKKAFLVDCWFRIDFK